MVGPDRTSGDVTVVAHRGFAGVNPENTLAAVRQAPAQGADAVEVDVMPAAGGEVVAFHDHTPDRVTDASGAVADRPVWETPLSELRDLEVLGTGEPVPLLSEVVDAVPPTVDLHVEFKNPGSDAVRFDEYLGTDELEAQRALWRPFAERVFDVLDTADNDVVVSSFYEGALAAVRAVAPAVSLSAIFWDSVADGLAVARRHDCEAVQVPMNAVAGTAMFGDDYAGGPYGPTDVVETAREEGRTVLAWTVETWHQAAELERAGVDGVVTDYPGLLRSDAASPAAASSQDGSAGD